MRSQFPPQPRVSKFRLALERLDERLNPAFGLSILPTITAPVATIVAPVAPVVEQIAPVVTQSVAETISTVSETLTPVVSQLVQIVAPLTEVVPVVITPAETLTSVLEPVSETLGTLVIPIIVVLDPVLESLTPVLTPITSALDPVLSPVTGSLDNLLGDVIAPVTTIVTDITDVVGDLATPVIPTIPGVIPSIPFVPGSGSETVDSTTENTLPPTSTISTPHSIDTPRTISTPTESVLPIATAVGVSGITLPGNVNVSGPITIADVGDMGIVTTAGTNVFVVPGSLISLLNDTGLRDGIEVSTSLTEDATFAKDGEGALAGLLGLLGDDEFSEVIDIGVGFGEEILPESAGEAVVGVDPMPEVLPMPEEGGVSSEFADLLTAFSPIELATLAAEFQNLMASVDQLGADLFAWLGEIGPMGWLAGGALAMVALEWMRQRKLAQLRKTQAFPLTLVVQ